VLERFAAAGYGHVDRSGPLEATLRSGEGKPTLRLRMLRDGRIFGGTYALEVAGPARTLPPTHGLTARGRGVVRLQGISFRARRADEAGRRLARQLGADERLVARLARVHFERIRVEADGRPVIRHLGGSVVWILFPPLVKAIPLVPEQVAATIAAMEAFAAAGRGGQGARS
jgi:hypothetical protein